MKRRGESLKTLRAFCNSVAPRSGLKLARMARVHDGLPVGNGGVRAVGLVRDDLAVGHGYLLGVGADALAFDCDLFAGGDDDGEAIEPALGVNRGHAARARGGHSLTIKAVLRVAAGEHAGYVRR